MHYWKCLAPLYILSKSSLSLATLLFFLNVFFILFLFSLIMCLWWPPVSHHKHDEMDGLRDWSTLMHTRSTEDDHKNWTAVERQVDFESEREGGESEGKDGGRQIVLCAKWRFFLMTKIVGWWNEMTYVMSQDEIVDSFNVRMTCSFVHPM